MRRVARIAQKEQNWRPSRSVTSVQSVVRFAELGVLGPVMVLKCRFSQRIFLLPVVLTAGNALFGEAVGLFPRDDAGDYGMGRAIAIIPPLGITMRRAMQRGLPSARRSHRGWDTR